jgi:hypothetical protein
MEKKTGSCQRQRRDFSLCKALRSNVEALAMWRYSVLRPPEPMLSKNTKDDDKNYSLALFVGWN